MEQGILSNLLFTLGVVAALEVARWVGYGLIRTARKKTSSSRAQTLASLAKNALKFGLWFFGAGIILSRWGVDISPLIAGAGVVGFAVGFGAQTLIKDILSGVFMIAEDYLAVGDEVEVAGKRGRVVAVKLRTVILRDEQSGEVHIIPNSMVGIISKKENKR